MDIISKLYECIPQETIDELKVNLDNSDMVRLNLVKLTNSIVMENRHLLPEEFQDDAGEHSMISVQLAMEIIRNDDFLFSYFIMEEL